MTSSKQQIAQARKHIQIRQFAFSNEGLARSKKIPIHVCKTGLSTRATRSFSKQTAATADCAGTQCCWSSGWKEKGLRQIIDSSINYKLKHGGTVRISWKEHAFDGSRLHRNATYNEVLDAIESIILFRLPNYFLRFSNDFKRKTEVEQFPNDWYEYVEYPITIGLQRLRFSRESAAYLRTHADLGYYTVNQANQVFLNPRILDCDNPEVRMEARKIQYNIPEFMFPAE